jgi:hypothetical protein
VFTLNLNYDIVSNRVVTRKITNFTTPPNKHLLSQADAVVANRTYVVID